MRVYNLSLEEIAEAQSGCDQDKDAHWGSGWSRALWWCCFPQPRRHKQATWGGPVEVVAPKCRHRQRNRLKALMPQVPARPVQAQPRQFGFDSFFSLIVNKVIQLRSWNNLKY